MRRYLVFPMALMLCACQLPNVSLGNVPTAPAQVADRSTIDESAIIGVRTLYEAWLTLVEVATDAGLIKPDKAQTVLDLDDRIHRVYQLAIRAYRFSNADDFDTAKTELRALILQGKAAIMENKL